MKTNEQILEDLRTVTSELLKGPHANGDEYEEKVNFVCNSFIQLDISLLDGGQMPGAWGSAKMSKSKMS